MLTISMLSELCSHDARSTRAEPFDYFGTGKLCLAATIEADGDSALGTAVKTIGNIDRDEVGDALSSDRKVEGSPKLLSACRL